MVSYHWSSSQCSFATVICAGLIHYSANQLGHGRRSAEKKRDENKAFNRILFYRPYTLNPRRQIFHGNKGDTVVLLFLYQCPR